MADFGKSIGLSNKTQTTLKKIKGICAKANTYYASITISNKWNVRNIGSGRSCWNCGGHDHRLTKCDNNNNQDHIDAKKNNWEEDNGNKDGGGGNY